MKTLRLWATPLTVATTLITLVTGIFLFFHYAPGLTRVSHEWIGMLMAVAVFAHLLLNWRAFTTYFKRPAGLTLMGLGAVAMAATVLVSMPAREGGPSGFRAAMAAMNTARIETLADLAGEETDAVLARLGAAGIDATADSTVSALSGGDRAAQGEIIAMVFSHD
ncbi:DUF4405 domain-containing protein [Sinisalibacter aestuarii]|uniref:Flavinylation-associated cytochrome domain-containing protein n=1 Tax=Sinisalibacter aestuarii TaxID=2949426 RepID=A0ABQ5LUH4_9RHOB|nr:DUF4405 domain-containing protein [Sinisalibacter aestuarii]GKY88634.1 hypothetical protein STA1M1_25030 [Sinisalibacter aestuarii]